MSLVILSFLLAVFIMSKFMKQRKTLSAGKKITMLYGFLFFAAFPIAFYVYGRTCSKALVSCNFIPSLLYSGFVTLILALVISFIIGPFLYAYSPRSKKVEKEHKLLKFVNEMSIKLKIKMPGLYVLDEADPVAFSFSNISPKIFLSVGLLELLNVKQIQAVLLHEMGHIKRKTSMWKITNLIFKLFYPIKYFTTLNEELINEELEADKVAIKFQKTDLFLKQAKNKIDDYKLQKKATDTKVLQKL